MMRLELPKQIDSMQISSVRNGPTEYRGPKRDCLTYSSSNSTLYANHKNLLSYVKP